MTLLKKVALAGVVASSVAVTSTSFAAQTVSSASLDAAVTISTTVNGVLTMSATTVSTTIAHDGGTPTNAHAVTLNNSTSTENQIIMQSASAASNTAIVSTGGTGSAIGVANDSVTATTVNGFGINIDQYGLVEKNAGAGDVIDIAAQVSIANSGTIHGTHTDVDQVIDINTSSNTTIYNSGVIGASVDLDADAVIHVDNTSVLHLINLSGGTISNTAAADTVIDASTAGAQVDTFTNYGNIINMGGVNDEAIDVSGDAKATTLTFAAGTVSGAIKLGGTLSDTINVTSSTVALNGNIVGDGTVGGKLDIDADFSYNTGGGAVISNTNEIDVASGNTFTLGNNQITSTVDLRLTGEGTVDITGFTGTAIAVSDSTTGLDIGQSVTLVTDAAAVIAGDVNLAGTVSGTLAIQSSSLTVASGSSVSGAISGSTASSETIYFDRDFTTAGNITSIESLIVRGGDLTVSETITDVDSLLEISATRTVTVNSSISGTGTLTFNGTLDIAAGQTVHLASLTAAAGASSTFKVNTNSTTASQLVLTSAAGGDDFSNTTFEVVLASNAQIANGATRTVVDGNGASLTTGSISFTSAVLSATIVASGDDLLLTFTRLNGFNTIGSTQTSAMGTALENLVGSATGDLATIIGQLDSLGTSTQVSEALETLAPTVDGLGTASLDIQTASMNTVADRLAYLRYGDKGLATGDGTYSEHMWIQAFGSVAHQGTRNGVDGFQSTGYGVAVGFDSEDIFEDALAGFSVAYSGGDVDGKSAADAQTDITSYHVNGYYSRDLADDTYVDAMIGLAYNDYETTRNVAVGSFTNQAKGDFSGWQVSGRAAAGRYYDMGGNLQLIPEASIQYTYLTLDKYTETGAGGANLTVDADDNNSLVIALGGTAAWDFEHAGGSVLRTELRGKYTYDVIGDEMTTSSTFTGGGSAFKTESAKVAQHGLVVGAGLKLLDAGGAEFGVDYDATLKADYINHSGQLKVRWAF
ncbi:MAG: autotransporter outer membrane beta-barrel domain-containing protein [Alphaproteobacteria bacterium]|nr:autotransporter outer membrane beta-barrel domain-containing protein [Alphaproteobacteria bacterium]MDD9919354.1 autotransporter outer membrane beta-barrel domain-containing protein [Alphaproteobacteria bacterium]